MTGALLLAPSSAAGRMRFDPQDLKQGWQREEGRSSLNRGTLSVDFLITQYFCVLPPFIHKRTVGRISAR